jgi:hypothetical protein
MVGLKTDAYQGKIDAKGNLVVMGRKDSMFISGGRTSTRKQ